VLRQPLAPSPPLACICCLVPRCPVRNLSFTYDGAYLAAGSEDPYIDIVSPCTGHCEA